MIALASRRPDRAGRDALALYRDAGRAAHLHTLVRWWSAPFPAIEQALPPVGRVLEIGCGHGLFSTYAALSAPGRTVHGVDIDPDKILAATAAGRHLPAMDGGRHNRQGGTSQSGAMGVVAARWIPASPPG